MGWHPRRERQMVGVDPDVGSSEFSKFPQPECTCLPHSRTPSWWLRLYKHRGCTYRPSFASHKSYQKPLPKSKLKIKPSVFFLKRKIFHIKTKIFPNFKVLNSRSVFCAFVSLTQKNNSSKMAATTMMTINHVLDCENELNDNLYNLKMCSGKNKSSPMRKILKPLMKLIKKRTQSCKKLLAKKNEKNQQQQQQLEVFTEEVDNQNNSNEALEQRLLDDLTKADEGAAIITIGQDGKMTVVPVSCYVPVHFLPTLAGDFFWTTLPQQVPVSDFYHKETIISQHQQIELQVI